MAEYQGKIMSKKEFLQNSPYSKEEYEGLLVAADTQNGIYNIGVELGEDKILLIEQATDDVVHERYHELIPKIQEIKRQHGVESNPTDIDTTWGGI